MILITEVSVNTKLNEAILKTDIFCILFALFDLIDLFSMFKLTYLFGLTQVKLHGTRLPSSTFGKDEINIQFP